MRTMVTLALLVVAACAEVEIPELPQETETDCTWGLFCFTTTTYADGHGVSVDFSYDGQSDTTYLLIIRTDQRSMEGGYEDRIELILDGPMERQILDLLAAPGTDFSYNWRFTVHPMDPDFTPNPEEYVYAYPFSPSSAFPVLQGPGGDGAGAHATHRGAQENAVDWALPIGTEVLAARDGVVAVAYDGSRLRWHGHENLVIVRHDDGTFAWYGHLLPGGAFVSAGDRVTTGMPIGLSGNSGYSSEPHLHFQVSVPTPGGVEAFRSLPVRFEN